MDIQRLGLKWFARDAAAMDDLEPAIEVMHGWIQEERLSGLPIDVADYRHVPAGPSMMLVGHECDYVLDHAIDNRAGFAYSRKRLLEADDVAGRLSECVKQAAAAAVLLENDERLPGLSFAGEELHVFSNDRLLAPNTDAGAAALQPAVEAFAQATYGEGVVVKRLENDPRQRLTFVVQAPATVAIADLV